MGKIKKLTALLACTVMVAGSLAGCGSATEPAAEEPAAEKPATEETTATEEPAALPQALFQHGEKRGIDL